MRWIVVAIVAAVLVALAPVFAVSSRTCVTEFDYGFGYSTTPGATAEGLSPLSTEQTCSRHFWWD